MNTETAVYFCPECGSAGIDRSALSGASASCRACGWSGAVERLAAMPFAHNEGSDVQLTLSLINDIRTMFTKDVGVSVAQFLNKWGFIDVAGNRALAGKQMGRYVAAIARAMVTAILEERNKMEVERARGS